MPSEGLKAKVACGETIKNHIYFIPKKRYVMVAAKFCSCMKNRGTDPYVRPETARKLFTLYYFFNLDYLLFLR